LRPPLPIFQRAWVNRFVVMIQLVYGVYVVTHEALDARRGAQQYLQTLAELPFCGIWRVEEFGISGEVQPRLSTDEHRWSRVIFEPDRFDGSPDLVVELANGTHRFFHAEFDKTRTVLNVRRVNDDRKWIPEVFRGQPPDSIIGTLRLNAGVPGYLALEGIFEG